MRTLTGTGTLTCLLSRTALNLYISEVEDFGDLNYTKNYYMCLILGILFLFLQ